MADSWIISDLVQKYGSDTYTDWGNSNIFF